MKAIVALLLAVSGSAYAGDEFVNVTAGFRVTKPSEWVYVTASENVENMRAVKLKDEEFHAAMLKYSTAPLVAMMKYQEPFEDVNPSFKVQIKPYGAMKGKPPKEVLEFLLPQIGRVFKDFVIAQAPAEVLVSGIASAYAKVEYTMEIPDGRTFPTTSEMWIVPHGEYFFMIGAGTRQDEKTGTRAEIREILDSVKVEG